jgi:DivIVA protein
MGAVAANSQPVRNARKESDAMSYFRRSNDVVEAPEEGHSAGSRWSELGGRLSRVFTVQEPPVDQAELEGGDYADDEVLPDESEIAARFPVGPFGYNRAAVDQYLAEMERELEELRNRHSQPLSINEEIERLGEQTASILVVAHDQANETTRRAQEQADRCIADAAANAVAMTEKAKKQLRELDSETDAVWQERRRLIDDVRSTASALIMLADEAVERFPADDKTTVDFPVTFAD